MSSQKDSNGRPPFRHVLLCTHGTPGAEKAEDFAFKHLLGPRAAAGKLTVFTVVNEDWKWMTGDDWLNSSATRMTFARHVESEIDRQIAAHWRRMREKIYPPNTAAITFLKKTGPVEATIARTAEELGCDLLVMGARQKRQAPGFKARVKQDKLLPLLPCPLTIVP